MPLASPIGTNKGLSTKDFIQIIIDEIDLPVIVDAGIGRPSQACEAMEICCITNRHLARGDYWQRLEKIAASGVSSLIIREKDMEPTDYEAYAEHALALCQAYGVTCVLHHFSSVALTLGASHFHCSLQDLQQQPDLSMDERIERRRSKHIEGQRSQEMGNENGLICIQPISHQAQLVVLAGKGHDSYVSHFASRATRRRDQDQSLIPDDLDSAVVQITGRRALLQRHELGDIEDRAATDADDPADSCRNSLAYRLQHHI